jgi:hypothetical protein
LGWRSQLKDVRSMEGLGATANHTSEEVTLLEQQLSRELIPMHLSLADVGTDRDPVLELTIAVFVPQIPHTTKVNLKRQVGPPATQQTGTRRCSVAQAIGELEKLNLCDSE